MDKEFQVQLSAEEIHQIAQGIFSAVSGAMVTCRMIDQLITVEDRCKERWPSATKKNKRRVRDVFVGMYRERLGRHPLKLTGHLNGTIAVEREHLAILDRAIDIVKDEAEGREALPLFSPRAR